MNVTKILAPRILEKKSSFEKPRTGGGQGKVTQCAKQAWTASNPSHLTPVSKPDVRVLCVSIFILGVIPWNAVVRILKLFLLAKQMLPCWIPDPSSIVNWIAKADLGMVNVVGPLAESWVALLLKEAQGISVLQDIGHITVNLLKAQYAKSSVVSQAFKTCRQRQKEALPN